VNRGQSQHALLGKAASKPDNRQLMFRLRANTTMHRNPHPFFMICMLVSLMTPAQAEPLDDRLERTLEKLNPHFSGHESVRIDKDDATSKKYLLLDFRYNQKPEGEMLQTSIHRICAAVLDNRDMVRELTEAGYYMVSVAFDRKHQYDCLP